MFYARKIMVRYPGVKLGGVGCHVINAAGGGGVSRNKCCWRGWGDVKIDAVGGDLAVA